MNVYPGRRGVEVKWPRCRPTTTRCAAGCFRVTLDACRSKGESELTYSWTIDDLPALVNDQCQIEQEKLELTIPVL